MDEIVDGLPRITVMAKEDINEGEEILLNYGPNYFGEFTCLCGHETKCVEIKKNRKKKKDREGEDDE